MCICTFVLSRVIPGGGGAGGGVTSVLTQDVFKETSRHFPAVVCGDQNKHFK